MRLTGDDRDRFDGHSAVNCEALQGGRRTSVGTSRRHRVRTPHTDGINPMGIDATAGEIVANGLGSVKRQLLIVGLRSNSVGVSRDLDTLTVRHVIAKRGRDTVKFRAPFRPQIAERELVEPEQQRRVERDPLDRRRRRSRHRRWIHILLAFRLHSAIINTAKLYS